MGLAATHVLVSRLSSPNGIHSPVRIRKRCVELRLRLSADRIAGNRLGTILDSPSRLRRYQLVPLPSTGIDHSIAATRHHELLLPGTNISDHPSLVWQDFSTLRTAVTPPVVVAAIRLDTTHVPRWPTRIYWRLILPCIGSWRVLLGRFLCLISLDAVVTRSIGNRLVSANGLLLGLSSTRHLLVCIPTLTVRALINLLRHGGE